MSDDSKDQMLLMAQMMADSDSPNPPEVDTV